VEELRLCSFLSRQELDVVDEQHVDRSVPLAEVDDAVVLHRVDHLVHEALARDVDQAHLGRVAEDVVTDGVHEVRLAEADTAVDEEGVVGTRRGLGDGAAGGVGKLIGWPDDERLEEVARIQPGAGRRREAERIGRSRVPGDWDG